MRNAGGRDPFSFYMHDGARDLCFTLVGEVSDAGAGELEQAWRTAQSTIAGRPLIVNFARATGVDQQARALFRAWHASGAQLEGGTPAAAALIAAITGRAVNAVARPTWYSRLASAFWRRSAAQPKP